MNSPDVVRERGSGYPEFGRLGFVIAERSKRTDPGHEARDLCVVQTSRASEYAGRRQEFAWIDRPDLRAALLVRHCAVPRSFATGCIAPARGRWFSARSTSVA